MTMILEFDQLLSEYVAELRDSKEKAERWWWLLQERHADDPTSPRPEDLWPMGAASHPWVIATYRKYFFKCAELNNQLGDRPGDAARRARPIETDWGVDEESRPARVEPKTFVLDLLAGGETHDLYEFMLAMVFVPIGMKGDELV